MDSERQLRSQLVSALDEVLPAAPWLEATVTDDLRQRRKSGSLRRRLSLPRPVVQWGAVAALLIVAIVAGLIATGALRPSKIAPAGIPKPSPVPTLPQSGELVPGTYRSDWLTLTLPAGWSAFEGWSVIKNQAQPPDGMGISPWEIASVYEDPCHSATKPATPIGPTVDDLVVALMAQNRSAGVKAVNTAIGGYRGKRLELIVPLTVDPAQCEVGLYRSWQDPTGGNRYNQAAGQHDALYILDVNGRRLVVNTSFYAASDQAELKAILDRVMIAAPVDILVELQALRLRQSAPQPLNGVDVQVPVGILAQGTYEDLNVDGQGFNVRFTIPAGWTWNGRYLSKGGVGLPNGAAIYFFGGPVQVYADPCHWAQGQSNGYSANRTVALLAAQPKRNATAPIDLPADLPGLPNRWPGSAVALTVPSDLNSAACDKGQFRSWGPENNARTHQGPGQRDVVWAVDIGGANTTSPGGLVIDAASFPGTPADVMSEIVAILGSIGVGHWG